MRPTRLRYAWIAFGLATILGGCDVPPQPRLNVLLITIDTLRADHLSGYGYARSTSPHIDAFFETATTFNDAHANSAWTLPSLASIMTSLHPTMHGAVRFNSRLDASHSTLAELLSAEGYRTYGIGTHTFLSETRGLQQGFAHFDDEVIHDPERTAEHVSSKIITDKAIRWLEGELSRTHEEPWLLWLHYFDPHTAYVRHPGISDAFGLEDPADLYDGEIAFTDHQLARVFDQLTRMGAEENTLVILTADHGEALGEHGQWEHSTNLFREVTMIPLAIRDPRLTPRRVDQPVESLDILPTLLDLLGIEVEIPLSGRSLAPAMRGDPIPVRPILAQTEIFSQYTADSLILGRWKLIADRSGALRRSADGEIVLRPKTRARGEPAYYLFDRELDPLERTDVADRHPKVVHEMRARLAAMLETSKIQPAQMKASRLPQYPKLDSDELDELRALGYLDDPPNP